MIKNWMSLLKDDVPITKVVMPGSHNAGSYGMMASGCCQDQNLYEQAISGVRHFCIRLDTVRKKIVMAHGISKGEAFETSLCDLKRALDELDTEFFILDIREYYPQKFGPIKLNYKADAKKVDELLEKYISPSKYALTDFDDISKVTMGDIRKSGKKFLLYNYKAEYKHSVACDYIYPWNKETYSLSAEKFVKEIPKIFDTEHTDGIYWFQTQQTPNPFTEIGMTSPRKLDISLAPHYQKLLDSIRDNPSWLAQANVIGGDFMTTGKKCEAIINLNYDKGNMI
ncbi:MAG: hypothetical protein IJB86_10785 [Clostridia bacterium]|nr:hypothetical protein [Clostridia bacterium]